MAVAQRDPKTLHPDDEEGLVVRLRRVREQDASLDAIAIRALLDRTESFRLRNAAAMALVDLGATESADLIGEILKRPAVAPQAGTLLFALDELGGALPPESLVNVIRNGSYEARAEALILVEEDRLAVSDPGKRAWALEQLSEIAQGGDREAAEAASEAMSLLGSHRGSTPAGIGE